MDDHLGAGLCAGFICGACIGALAGWDTTSVTWEREAIERGYAEHDRMTGEWKWIEPKSTQKENDNAAD